MTKLLEEYHDLRVRHALASGTLATYLKKVNELKQIDRNQSTDSIEFWQLDAAAEMLQQATALIDRANVWLGYAKAAKDGLI